MWEKPGFNMKTMCLSRRKKSIGEPIGQPNINLFFVNFELLSWIDWAINGFVK
jgi:hypothetical protein